MDMNTKNHKLKCFPFPLLSVPFPLLSVPSILLSLYVQVNSCSHQMPIKRTMLIYLDWRHLLALWENEIPGHIVPCPLRKEYKIIVVVITVIEGESYFLFAFIYLYHIRKI